MSSIIGLITTWSAIRLVYWLSHTPTWAGVLEFAIPLLLLPLLASSYAEVNYEGAKIIQVSQIQQFQLGRLDRSKYMKVEMVQKAKTTKNYVSCC